MINTQKHTWYLGEGTSFIWTNPNTGIWICGFSYMSKAGVDHGGFKVYILRNAQREKRILGNYIFPISLRYKIRGLT